MNNSELANKCQGIAGCMSFNDSDRDLCTKRVLLECAHRLNSSFVQTRLGNHGEQIIWNAIGKQRYMTWRERIAYWLAGALPEV